MSNERRERAIRIIKGLMEKRVERGSTPSEAAASVSKIQELLERYQISMLDVEKQELKDDMIRHNYDTGRQRINPGEQSLASAVAAGYDCKLVIEPGSSYYNTNAKYVFLGYQTDVEIAQYCFTYLLRVLTTMANNSGASNGAFKQKLVRYRNNFLMGAAGVIRQRMLADKEARNNPVTPDTASLANVPTVKPNTGAALTLIKKPKVEEFVKTQYNRLVNRPESKVRYNANALEEGRKAGRVVELRKAIETEEIKRVGN